VPRARRGTTRPSTVGLPPDVVSQSAARLRILALLYAFVFFMAGVFPALLLPGDRAHFLSSFGMWGPAMIGIAVALAVALVVGSPRVSLDTAMKIGLAFEVVDLKLTDDLIKLIEGDLCVDTTQVFALGFSYGGSMSYALACARPNVFRVHRRLLFRRR